MSETIGEHIKAAIFDHDDTTVGTIEAKWAQHKCVAKEFYGKDLTDTELAEHWGIPLHKLVCVLYGTDDVETAMANNRSRHEDFPKKLFPYTIETLTRLKGAGLVLGTVTATSRHSFEHDLKLHGMTGLYEYTQAAEDTQYHKPDPRVFDPLIEWLAEREIEPYETLYTADGLHDMKAALGAGFEFLGVHTGLVTQAEFQAAGARSVPHLGHLALSTEQI